MRSLNLPRTVPALPGISTLASDDFILDRLAPACLFAYQLLVAFLFITLPFQAYRHNTPTAAISTLRSGQLFQNATQNPWGLAGISGDFWIPYLVGLMFLFCSIWVFYLRRNNIPARVFALFACAAGFALAGLFDHLMFTSFEAFWISAVAIAGASLINLALIFPQASRLIHRLPLLPWLVYAPAVVFTSLPVLPLRPVGKIAAVRFSTQAALLFALFGLVLFLGMIIGQGLSSPKSIPREQSRLILWGALLSFGGSAVLAAWSLGNPATALKPAFFLPLALFPLTAGYALIRYQPLKTDTFLVRAGMYAILTFFAGGIYILLLTGLSLIAGSKIPANQPILIVLFAVLMAICLNPMRGWIQRAVETTFNQKETDYQQQIRVFTQELTKKQEIRDILNSLRDLIQRSLSPALLHIFLSNPSTDEYIAARDGDGRPTTDLCFPGDSPLIVLLGSQPEPLRITSQAELPEILKGEQNRLALLGATLFVNLPGQKRLIGWICLGPKFSGESYAPPDIRFLKSISDQAALAIERLQVIENLEGRVREMDVLTRVAQGVNITPQFDDILELIYAQTCVILPSQDFRITLINPPETGAYHAFYLQGDERIYQQENILIPPRQGLESLVIQMQRSLLTEDYERECRSRGILPDQQGIFSWVGVPLNAGARAIGAISLGSRKPEVVYSDQQLTLLQAIADQAAGAIVKARLLEEMKKRALQLATLNEVGRSLTSTLEIQPLLSQILDSACSILNCEAGSLLLVDNSTGELIVKVTSGPFAGDLVGKRLAPGLGIVGKVVEEGKPLIANQAQDTRSWFERTDQQTGFSTRDLMAVPLLLKESAIGVIELINKRDGSPFTKEDEELLSTLSSQAAIAIENARLYTQTDDALNSRLEEMSVMQRIDRELNASLDVNRTMRIALEWSMSQTDADAGVIGFVKEDETDHAKLLRFAASAGLPEGNERLIKVELASILETIRDGQPYQVDFSPIPGSKPMGLLETSRSRAVIPIRRKSDVIGLMLLESEVADRFSTETLTFLSRLSDHAAIAISNALLYADLQSANIAKSEFISLVSHELKTPMTSIRGYTDLLAQGTVGPVNEIQSNFLNTIRSNVNRMANLVSDLADVSRIEAGRLHLDFRAITVEEVISEVVRSVQALLNEKEHALEMTIPEDLPQVWGDQNRLIQIMNNLVSNAIKYTQPNGEIQISAERSDNLWDPDGAPQVVHICVADNGLGISKEDQEKVFQKFFRSTDQNVRDLPGTGLGLNITRHLVQMQGGCIWFESDLGQGSAFHYTIPVAATTG